MTHCAAASPPSPRLPLGRRVLVTVKRAQAHECWAGRPAPSPEIHAQTCASSRCTMGRDRGGGKTTCDPCACNMALAGHSNLAKGWHPETPHAKTIPHGPRAPSWCPLPGSPSPPKRRIGNHVRKRARASPNAPVVGCQGAPRPQAPKAAKPRKKLKKIGSLAQVTARNH